jgi:hypothetical protein
MGPEVPRAEGKGKQGAKERLPLPCPGTSSTRKNKRTYMNLIQLCGRPRSANRELPILINVGNDQLQGARCEKPQESALVFQPQE